MALSDSHNINVHELREYVALHREVSEIKKVLHAKQKRKSELEQMIKKHMVEMNVDNYDLQNDGFIHKKQKKLPCKKPSMKELPVLLNEWVENNVDDLVLQDTRQSKLQELIDMLLGRDKEPAFCEVIKLDHA